MIRELTPINEFSNNQQIELLLNDFSLNSLLPRNWQIYRKHGSKLHCDPERKAVFIPWDFVPTSEPVFSLLHEFGHAHINETSDEVELDQEIFIRNKFTYLGYDSFSESEKIEWQKIIKIEKEAWNYAIKTYNNLIEAKYLKNPLSKNEMEKIIQLKINSYIPKLDK